ncbi:hypothetical protein ACGFNU_39840 [Spirillospora sp. NPDC048911]|uniref:hypothetical protein n=1 Tax=Spirillospora sp. NPDC048911 TaxID=3364527 RepID=UPI003710A7B7
MGPESWSIEVFNGEFPATAWRDSYRQALVESALTNGAVSWMWYAHSWGVVFEVTFAGEEAWERWRDLPGTRAALDSVPDPVNGLLVYRGKGGTSGAPMPRRPRPAPGAAALAIEVPLDEDYVSVDRIDGGLDDPYATTSPVAGVAGAAASPVTGVAVAE